ncbi:MAG: hypothetical protein JWM11_7987, partial [Planctomycetaceae bacterium]|nr:hypothetical protein [Planctomycetaceae bacterium]
MSPAPIESTVSHPDPGRLRFTLWRSATGLMHTFFGVTSAAWFLLLAITFTDRSILILVASLFWLLIAGLTLLLCVYLSRKHLSRKRIILIAAVWILFTLVLSNFTVANLQTRQRLWSGFVFDSLYGWYPEA